MDDLQNALRESLSPDEPLLWSGTSNPRVVRSDMGYQGIGYIGPMLFWFGVAVSALMVGFLWYARMAPHLYLTLFIPGVLVLMGFALMRDGPKARQEAANTAYGITPKRILKALRTKEEVYVNTYYLEPNFSVRRIDAQESWGALSITQPDSEEGWVEIINLRGIAYVAEVEALLRAQIALQPVQDKR